ncbi:MAG: hypothetical protein WCP77_06555 [Roseococcus sp.]
MPPRTDPQPPVIWLLGLPGSGQTSLVAGLLDQWRSVLRHDLAPATATAEMLEWPLEAPRIRFLITTGFTVEAPYDPAEDLAFIGQAPALILAVLRADEPDAGPLHALLTRVRATELHAPILLAQTDLHALYPRDARHPMPYPYGAGGLPGPGVPSVLAEALKAQRKLFDGVVAGFVPVDFTSAAQGFPPGDYGLAALRAAMHRLAPEWMTAIAPLAAPESGLWARAILPWALAAAAADALPGLVGVPALAAQGLLLRAISRRFGLSSDITVWAYAAGVLGTGLVLRSGLAWALNGLSPFGSMAALAAWSFLASCLIGVLAVRFCRIEAEGIHPSTLPPEQARKVEQAVGRGGARF